MLVKYNNSILNLANSIREYYGLDTYYDTDKDVSEWLNNNNFKHLFLILIDGMGSRILDEKLDRHSFCILKKIIRVLLMKYCLVKRYLMIWMKRVLVMILSGLYGDIMGLMVLKSL